MATPPSTLNRLHDHPLLDTVARRSRFPSTIIVNNSGDGEHHRYRDELGRRRRGSGNVLSDVDWPQRQQQRRRHRRLVARRPAVPRPPARSRPRSRFLSGSANGCVQWRRHECHPVWRRCAGFCAIRRLRHRYRRRRGGLIEAGTGTGHSLRQLAQATALVGGSSTDILAAISLGQKNTTMIAGSGAETLASLNQGAVFQGVGVSTLMGQGSIAPSTTNMVGEIRSQFVPDRRRRDPGAGQQPGHQHLRGRT